MGRVRLLSLFWGACISMLVGCSANFDERVGVSYDSDSVARGSYLVNGLAACGYCHGNARSVEAELVGGLPFYDRFGEVLAPNLTAGAEEPVRVHPQNIRQVIRSGRSLGDYISHEAHAGYEWLSDSDLHAIIAYLTNLPARRHQVMRRSLSTFELNSVGAFEESFNVRGVVPDLEKQVSEEYGKYLVQNVARCSGCHNGPVGWFAGEELLAGGRYITDEFGVREVPSLRSLRARGWSEQDLRSYLKSGLTPNGRHIPQYACPTNFYANADDTDLKAIAKFLHDL